MNPSVDVVQNQGQRNRPGRPCKPRRSEGTKSEREGTPTRSERDSVETRNRVVQQNLGLVYRVARQFLNRGLTIEDLVGEGTLGLIRAAEAYDPSLGTRFSTYANYWIKDSIQAALANTATTIRLPMNVSKLLDRWRQTERSLCQLRGYAPTFDEVAASMDLDPSTLRLLARAHRVSQLDLEPTNGEDCASRTLLMLDERSSAEETLADREERESIKRRFKRLDGKQRAMVEMRYGLAGEPPMSFEQIGGRLGMAPSAVHRAVSAALRKLGAISEPRPPDRSDATGSGDGSGPGRRVSPGHRPGAEC